MVRASGLVSPVSGRPMPVARAYVDPEAAARRTPRTRVGSGGRRTRVGADEDETAEGRARAPAPASRVGRCRAAMLSRDREQDRREPEGHHRRDGHADGEDGAEVQRLVGAGAASRRRSRCRAAAASGRRRSAKPRVTSRATKRTSGGEHHPPGADDEHRHRRAVADQLHDEAAGAPEHAGEGHLEEAEASTAGGDRAEKREDMGGLLPTSGRGVV